MILTCSINFVSKKDSTGNPPSQVIDVIEKQSRDDGDPLCGIEI
jgi:hypothetical protein